MNNNMKSTIAAIAITLALAVSIGCASAPSANQAESWLPKDVQAQYDEFSRRANSADEDYSKCLGRAGNDISAQYCKEEYERQSPLEHSARNVDSFLRYYYLQPIDEKDGLQVAASVSHQLQADGSVVAVVVGASTKKLTAEQVAAHTERMRVVAIYDWYRCHNNPEDYKPFSASKCDDVKQPTQ